jgi:uncharacterized protein (TIGR02996 family)
MKQRQLRKAFLQEIILHPDDDTPRLVYADWLDEHGDPDRAEFIRIQCELAKGVKDLERRRRLRDWQRTFNRGNGYSVWQADEIGNNRRMIAVCRRGFVELVMMPARDFLLEGDSLFRRAPVRELILTVPVRFRGEEWARLARHSGFQKLRLLRLVLTHLEVETARVLADGGRIDSLQRLILQLQTAERGAATPLRRRLGDRVRVIRQSDL